MMTASSRYAALSAARTTVLENAREASSLTLPGTIPDQGQNEHFVSEQPWQSQGSRGVMSLAARLTLALFPPNLPFFRLAIDAAVAKALDADATEANVRLAALSQTVHSLMEGENIRQSISTAIEHLIIAGNYLLWQPEKGRPRGFRLDQFVVKRNTQGEFMVIIVHEKVFASQLKRAVRAAVNLPEKEAEHEQPIDSYIVVERQGDKVVHWQEINNVEVPNSRGESPAESTGWLPLRWKEIPGSDYGRSHVTAYIGDLLTLESNAKAMAEMAAIAARVINVVNPSSVTDIEELAGAASGDYIHGNADDVKVLQLDKMQDWSVIKAHSDNLEKRLAAGFLIQDFRQAERVTAEEIRAQAEELETALGGNYSVISNELQRPLISRWLYLADRRKLAPKLPKSVSVKLVTGMDALGRASEANRVRAWLSDIIQIPGVAEQLNGGAIARRMGLAHGIDDLDSLIKSPDQQAEEAEQAQVQQAATAATPEIAKAAMSQLSSNEM